MSEENLSIFDVEFALSQFSGNQALLIKILIKFIEQNENFEQELKEHLLKEDLIDAKRHVHTLKGVAGNLGFKALTAESGKVEAQIQDNIGEEQFSTLLALLDSSLDTAKQYCGIETTDTTKVNSIEAAPVDKADDNSVNTAKQQFITVLNNNEFLSDAKLAKYIESVELSDEQAEKITQLINDFDYKNAIQILK